MRAKQYSIRTEKTYLYWIHAFIRFHNCQHPKDMGVHEIRSYLDYFAIHANVTPNTQKTALNALVFMYRNKKINFTALMYLVNPNNKTQLYDGLAQALLLDVISGVIAAYIEIVGG